MEQVTVVLGVLWKAQRVLICRRPEGRHLGGYWEFPGGKRQEGEESIQALRRELREELGVTIRSVEPMTRFSYRYPDRHIHFEVFHCRLARGRPRPLSSTQTIWADPGDFSSYRFPPANDRILRQLRQHSVVVAGVI